MVAVIAIITLGLLDWVMESERTGDLKIGLNNSVLGMHQGAAVCRARCNITSIRQGFRLMLAGRSCTYADHSIPCLCERPSVLPLS